MGDLVDYLLTHEEGFRKTRLPALYSDFRSLRTLNPDGYTANIATWRRGLASVARSGLAPSRDSSPSLLILTTDESLLRALGSKQYGMPLALGAVVRESIHERDLIPLEQFLKAKDSVYYKSWSSLPWTAMSWGLRQFGVASGSSDEKLPGGRFVVIANVEAATKAFTDKTQDIDSRSLSETIWTTKHFKQTFAGLLFPKQRLSDTDLDVLLKYMSRDKNIILCDGKTVKLKSPGDDNATITSEDEAVSQLKELTDYLNHQINILTQRIDELTAAAKDAVLRKNRVAALAALRSKKTVETSLATRFATLAQLEAVATKIEQAADQVDVVSAMAAGADALSSLNARIGGTERVESVVDRLREQMDAVDEVSSIIAEAGGTAVVVDEAEIDDELAELESEERARDDAARRKVAQQDQTQREEALQKEAEATKRRLAEIGGLNPDAAEVGKVANADRTREALLEGEAVEGLQKLSLEDRRLTEAGGS